MTPDKGFFVSESWRLGRRTLTLQNRLKAGIIAGEISRSEGMKRVKIVIISDLHANLEALEALPETYTELWVLGDLVNFGINPAEIIEFVKGNAAVVIRGNHDQAVGYDQEPRCIPRYRRMAEFTQQYTASVLTEQQKQFLRDLPLERRLQRQNTQFYLCHAKPSDPLYGYIPPDSPEWIQEVQPLGTDVLLVGHTHVALMRRIRQSLIVNPGSLGQPSGKPEACYAVWEDGVFQLKTYSYPVAQTVAKVRTLSFPRDVQDDLEHILETGSLS